MRRFIATIAAALAVMAMTISRWVRRVGRWVLEQITPPSPPTPIPPPELIDPSPDPVDDFRALRRVAGILAQDRVPEPEDLVGLHDDHLRWLRVLDRRALCRVLAADDATLRAHIRGTKTMKQMPRADRDAVADLLRARERDDPQAAAEVERNLTWAPAL